MLANCRRLLQCNLLKAALLLLLLWLHGCSRLPVFENLPSGIVAGESLRVTAGSPFAWHPDGETVTAAQAGLRLWSPATGELKSLSPETSTALVWSPDGTRLAVARAQGDDTQLTVFDGSGSRVREVALEGHVESLFWSPEQGLLAVATTLKPFTFGANFTLMLYRWQESAAPARTVLHEATLKPLTLHRWGGILHRTPGPALSSLGDELLFARLHDPPAFSPYLKIILRHLETGAEREVASVPITAGGAVFAGKEDTVIYGDGRVSRALDPWSGRGGETLPTPGQNLAVSPGGSYLFSDGRLFRDAALLAVFPGDAVVRFSPQGDRLLLRHGQRLFLLSGLHENMPADLPEAYRRQLLLLRKWRSSGLISPQDYLEQKQRMDTQ